MRLPLFLLIPANIYQKMNGCFNSLNEVDIDVDFPGFTC